MKKATIPALICACILFVCCNKGPAITRVDHEPGTLLSKLVSELNTADSLSVFVKTLKKLSLTKDETANGITLFIPVNGNSGQPDKIGFVGDSVIAMTESIVRDHIIQGIIDYPTLTTQKIFTTLSGKTIVVKRSADTIWVNGVQFGGRQKILNNDYAVHTIKTSLSLSNPNDTLQTTSLDVTVWDATRWSPSRPKGEIAPNATVTAYESRLDFTFGIAAAQTKTNYQGRALFKNLKVGNYFIEADLNGKSNVFVASIIPSSGYFIGYAISNVFKDEQEVNAAPPQAGAAPGNFRWMDINGDGKITLSDYHILPYESASTIDGIKLRTSVSIGLPKNR